jgi:hypothetical protein
VLIVPFPFVFFKKSGFLWGDLPKAGMTSVRDFYSS